MTTSETLKIWDRLNAAILELTPIKVEPKILSEGRFTHAEMMRISDYHCPACGDDGYWMTENMSFVPEPHGDTTVCCPVCGSSELES